MKPLKINRRTFLKRFLGLTATAGLAATGGYQYGLAEARNLVVEAVEIPLKNLPSALEGFRIVMLGDLHLSELTPLSFLQEAITLANNLKPDLIALVGDYVWHEVEVIFDLAPVLAKLNAKYGVFAVLGNHDLWTNVNIVTEGLNRSKIPLLVNKGLTLNVGKSQLYLAGLDDAWSGKPNLEAALAKHLSNTPSILLAHEPDPADIYALDGRVSLHLAGHSHGGQVKIPGIGALITPYLAKKYKEGLFNINNMWLYTTRGVGTTILPFRINCPPEITEITLKRM